MVSQKVFIVGAGPSGLVALKEMLEAGHDAMAIDASSHIGGVFSLKPGAVYENLHLTISNYLMAYSDFPPLEDRIQYSTSEEYAHYLVRYAEHFELMDHIQLNTKVVNAKLGPWGTWQIKTMTSDGRTEMHEADSLIVATGSNHVPTHPFGGLDIPVVHSSEYLDSKPFVGKKVLVVGMGESSGDIAAQISAVADECTIFGRRSPMVAPRFYQSICDDKCYSEAEHLKPGKNDKHPVADYLECITTTRISSGCSVGAYGLARKIVWQNQPGSPSWDVLKALCLGAMEDPVMVDSAAVATKTAFYCDAAAQGKLNIVICDDYEFRGKTLRCNRPKYAMRNGKVTHPQMLDLDIDVILACTGYKTFFDWLEADIQFNPRTWYKHCYPPNMKEKLAFMGWARPHQGGIPICAEMLCRYHALVLKGERKLPADIAERTVIEAEQERAYFHQTPNCPASLIDLVSFMGSVSRLIGCEPRAPWNPVNYFKYMLLPDYACNYRTRGPGANPEAYKAVMSKFSVLDGFKLPVPLLIHYTVFYMIGRFMNFFTYFMGSSDKMAPFPAGWKTRMSKRYLLHGNKMRFSDLFQS